MRDSVSFNTHKALMNALGETAGAEVATLFQQLTERIRRLERSKVDVTPIVRNGAPIHSYSHRDDPWLQQ